MTAPEQHPWFGCAVERWNPLVQAQLDTTLDRLATAADELDVLHGAIAGRWGLATERSLDGAAWLLGVLGLLDGRPAVPASWLRRADLPDLVQQARAWEARCQEQRRRRAALTARYSDSLLGWTSTRSSRPLKVWTSRRSNDSVVTVQRPDRALSGRGAIERCHSASASGDLGRAGSWRGPGNAAGVTGPNQPG